MFRIRFPPGFLAALCFAFSASSVWPQPPDAKAPSQDPTQNPRKVKSEMKDAHRRWISEDVPYIATTAEKKAFLALQTDDERENFIAIFWRRRDPDPDTEENEYREEYYERIAYANEHFTSGIPGWKTDRGRIYIAWGKPDSIESNLRPTNEHDVGQRFVIGNAKVIPNLTGIYKRGQRVGIYLQIYNAGVDQTTLRPDIDVEYVVTKAGIDVLREKEDWSGLSDSGQRLTLARLLPTEQMPTGDYEIKIFTKDRVGGQVIENKGKFTITQ